MITSEDYCVGCPKEMGCLGSICPYKNVVEYHCDECGDIASYRLDGRDLCEECAKEFLQQLFDDSTIMDKAEMFDISFEEYT